MSESSRLSRWSQRKLAARRGGALPEPEAIAPAITQDELDKTTGKKLSGEQALAPARAPNLPADAEQDEDMLTEADLPPIEELSAQSDYTVFLKKNVPEMLRRRALRKLWVSDPVLANLDGLNDYDDDYTIVQAMTMDDTIYKIGRGLLGDEPEPELEAGESKPPQSAESVVEADAPESEANDSAAEGNSDAPPAAVADASVPVGAADPEDGKSTGTANPKSLA
jgi:hypothetical protein